MHPGALHRLITVFDGALRALGVSASAPELEALAALIHKAMTVQARQYHNLEHVFAFVQTDNPIQTLTGLFHDIVYYQVDLGFLPEIETIIAPYIQQDGDRFAIATHAPDEPQFNLALEAFDLRRGQPLTLAGGLNEFLSAVVLNCRLGSLLPLAALLQLDLCIEATIPFRGPTAAGVDAFGALEARLAAVNARWALGMGPAEIAETMRLAVCVANKDVESFAESDPAVFLANTWRLLPETNVSLRARNVYTIREYRQALQGTETFFSRLDPCRVFHQYAGAPKPAVYRQMIAAARRNIDLARRYLRLKLLAQAVLEALAEATGGDAPLSLFLGEAAAAESLRRFEAYLPPLADPAWADPASDLYRLLEAESHTALDFDLNTTPLSLYIYRCIDPAALEAHLERAERMFAGTLPPAEFLSGLGHAVVAPVARAGAAMVFTRRNDLLKFC